MSGPGGDLGDGFVFRDGSLTLTLSNLAAGEYELLTFHHDSCCGQANVDVEVTDALGTEIKAFDVLAGVDAEAAAIAIAEIDFVSDGVNDVILEFIESGAQPRPESVVVLNGFQLNQVTAAVPEPASIAIWSLLGLIGFGVWRWRARK